MPSLSFSVEKLPFDEVRKSAAPWSMFGFDTSKIPLNRTETIKQLLLHKGDPKLEGEALYFLNLLLERTVNKNELELFNKSKISSTTLKKKLSSKSKLSKDFIPLYFSLHFYKFKKDKTKLAILTEALDNAPGSFIYYKYKFKLESLLHKNVDEDVLEKALARAPEKYSRLRLLREAAQYYAQYNISHRKSVELLLRGLEEVPDNFQFLADLGWAYYVLSKHRLALDSFKRAVTLSNKKEWIYKSYLEVISSYFNQAYRSSDLVSLFYRKNEIYKEIKVADAHFFLGGFFKGREEFDKATEHYELFFQMDIYAELSPLNALESLSSDYQFKYKTFDKVYEKINELRSKSESPLAKFHLSLKLRELSLKLLKNESEVEVLNNQIRESFNKIVRANHGRFPVKAATISYFLFEGRIKKNITMAKGAVFLCNELKEDYSGEILKTLTTQSNQLLNELGGEGESLSNINLDGFTDADEYLSSSVKLILFLLDNKDLVGALLIVLILVIFLFFLIFLRVIKRRNASSNKNQHEALVRGAGRKRKLIITSSKPSILKLILRYISLAVLIAFGFGCVLTYEGVIDNPFGVVDTLVYGVGNEVRVEGWPPKVKKEYPNLKLITSEGKKISLKSFKGKTLLVELIGMTCQGCHAFSGGHKLEKTLGGIRPQLNLKSIEEYFNDFTSLDLFNSNIHFLQVVIYDLKDKKTNPSDAIKWAKHFYPQGLPKNVTVAVPEDSLVSPVTYSMIPSFHLIDKNSIYRSNGKGQALYRDLLPLAASIISSSD